MDFFFHIFLYIIFFWSDLGITTDAKTIKIILGSKVSEFALENVENSIIYNFNENEKD